MQNYNEYNQSVGEQVLLSRSIPAHNYYYWVGVAALLLTIVVFNVIYVLTLTYLSRKSLLRLHLYWMELLFCPNFLTNTWDASHFLTNTFLPS